MIVAAAATSVRSVAIPATLDRAGVSRLSSAGSAKLNEGSAGVARLNADSAGFTTLNNDNAGVARGNGDSAGVTRLNDDGDGIGRLNVGNAASEIPAGVAAPEQIYVVHVDATSAVTTALADMSGHPHFGWTTCRLGHPPQSTGE